MGSNQRGITALGMLILISFLGLFVFAGLRLTPMYLENQKIASILEDVQLEWNGKEMTAPQIRYSIEKRMNVEDVKALKLKDFKIKQSKTGYSVRADYERRAPYIANIYLLVDFKNGVEIKR